MKNTKTMSFLLAMAAFNLQLFAEQNMNATTSATTGNDLSAENKTFYDMALIDEAGPQLVYAQFGQKRPIPKNGGKTIEFRKFSNLPKATQPLTEGVTPAGSKLNVTAITATVSQYGDYVLQTDMLELSAIDNTILETTKLLGKQAGLTLDTVVRNVLMAGTNVNYCPKTVSGTLTEVTSRAGMDTTSKLTVDVVKRVVAKMKAHNVPKINGDYVAIIHPYVAYDLMSDPAWIEAHKYARPEELYNGELGKIAGVRFVETSEGKIWRDSTCPAQSGASPAYHGVFGTIFLGANAFGDTEITGGGLETIIKQKGSAGTADPLNQRSSIGWKATKVAEILVPNYIVRVESVSPVYSPNAIAN